MPGPFPERRAVQLEIVRRVAAGEYLERVCREPGMPTVVTVRNWRRAMPWFAEEVAEARARGEWRRRWMYDEAKGREILARRAAGEPLLAISRSPGMPSLKTIRHWAATDSAFGPELRRLAQEGLGPCRRNQRLRERFRHFDPAVADRIIVAVWRGAKLRPLLRSDRMYPSLAVLARWRTAEPEFDAALKLAMKAGRLARGRAAPEKEVTDAVIEAIATGGSLRSVAQRPDMPCRRTLYAWYRRRPEFAEAVDWACDRRDEWFADRALEMAKRAAPGAVGEARAAMAPLNSQWARLQKRPGWKRRRGA